MRHKLKWDMPKTIRIIQLWPHLIDGQQNLETDLLALAGIHSIDHTNGFILYLNSIVASNFYITSVIGAGNRL
jgi:hypothetical protein